MQLTPETCYRALESRDVRFDGRFFVGVSTTGVYCRPICRARTPKRDRCSFYRSPAEAERAGFRACFRCRPELAPGSAPVEAIPRLVARAVARIEEGFLNEHAVADLASELGVTERHLRRAMEDVLGVAPIELAQSHRLALAKQLIQDTEMSLVDVAFASGFQSVRRFNASFRDRFGAPPSAVRKNTRAGGGSGLSVRLGFRTPFAFRELLAFLKGRAIPGVEVAGEDEYRRTLRFGARIGSIRVRLDEDRDALIVGVSPSLAGSLMKIVARVRVLFDLDAEPALIAEGLSKDPLLAPLVARVPGLRVPGAIDPFEMAVRAVLGQQVTVRAATTIAGRLVERFGSPVPEPEGGLTHVFPEPRELAVAEVGAIASLGMPGKRAECLAGLAKAIAKKSIELSAGARMEELEALPGFGPWTAQYVAMRALGSPDVFLAGDLGVKKALGGADQKTMIARAEAWRPWRSYAVMYLWTGGLS